MRIINAVWEKRNLGVECVEFEISAADDMGEIAKVISAEKAEYQVAKVPTGDVKSQIVIQDCGFKFFETNFQLERRIVGSNELPHMYARFKNDLSFRDATDQEIENILTEVASGSMFTTDKVAQDPIFSPQLSGRRYSLWARDIIENGAKTVLGLYKGNIASFTIYEIKDKYYHAFIGGMLNEYRDKGLGFIPLYVTGGHILQNGGGILKTGVSSNNPAILRLQLMFGCKIKDMTNIYIKHK